MDYLHHPSRSLRHLLSAPFIYIVIFPVVVLDLFLELYHRVCFPLYGLPYVRRSDYIRIDRQKLSYLSFMQKLNCMYCGYVNGFLAYAVAIAGATERYWCGIQHQKRKGFHAPQHHGNFLAYGDAKAFEKKREGK